MLSAETRFRDFSLDSCSTQTVSRMLTPNV
jgi:hypothetical protein